MIGTISTLVLGLGMWLAFTPRAAIGNGVYMGYPTTHCRGRGVGGCDGLPRHSSAPATHHAVAAAPRQEVGHDKACMSSGDLGRYPVEVSMKNWGLHTV